MAGICTSFKGQPNADISAFVCDTIDELMNDAPTTTKMGTGVFEGFNHYGVIGSTATVGNNGVTAYYMLFSAGWQEV